eukprot:CAMPEP_0195063572 /NCGR_PEP_ID=MMETSP0448-20130528/9913_1 /TAXON_ID=66468 /ORGANISM="Heterocapsa triquestra, Strain CCMP 448" /LENGTH=49 /DNA_ID= /DNA_START= /DNA_END= /DNA_ORIENTATION=
MIFSEPSDVPLVPTGVSASRQPSKGRDCSKVEASMILSEPSDVPLVPTG